MPQLRKLLSGSLDVLIPLIALALALIIGAAVLVILGANPLDSYVALVRGAFGSTYSLTQILVKATPLLLVGLGIVIAFRGGVINIGGEGQIIVGALAATAVALYVPLPGVIVLPLALLGGVIGGALWGGIPGVLKARLGVNEILSTVMMNQIAFQLSNFLLRGPMIDPEEIARGTRIAQSAELPREVWLVRLVPSTLLHGGAILAVIMAVVVYIFARKPFRRLRLLRHRRRVVRQTASTRTHPRLNFIWRASRRRRFYAARGSSAFGVH
ncbi:MAG: ABC transporter permease [Chloroflexi bacterium]|nr:ABC transporter permease [Chloroflexota bacterium]